MAVELEEFVALEERVDDLERHRDQLDRRLEEIIEACQESEKLWIARLHTAEKLCKEYAKGQQSG